MITEVNEFALYAQTDPRIWFELVGQPVTHAKLGAGTIVEVTPRKGYMPLIEVLFPSEGKRATFNSDSFMRGAFVTIEIPSSLLPQFSRWRTERENQQVEARSKMEAYEKGKQEFRSLAEKYNIRIEKVVTPDGPTLLGPVLVKIEAREELGPDEIRHLESEGCENVAATYFYRCYRVTGDLWKLVRACSLLRKAGQPDDALKVSAHAADVPALETTAQSALVTTRGGAYRDIFDLDKASECARQAIAMTPDRYYPYNLLGAILYEEGRVEEGNSHFEKAIALGSSQRVQDAEIRKALDRSKPATRRSIVEYLLSKDPARYAWTRVFVA